MTDLQEALEGADKLFDRSEIEAAIKRVGNAIDEALAGESAVLVTVMNGALIFAAELALSIRSQLALDYVHVARYHDREGGQLHWKRKPSMSLGGRNVILVDDILDEGHTLKAVREACYDMGAKRVMVATLSTKIHDRRVEGIEADFNGVELPDRFVVGFGMDYNGYGRNLPHIFALRD